MAASWLFGRDLLVGGGGQQLVEVGGIRGLYAEHPCGERVLVHLLGRGRQVRVGGDDLAGDGRVDVARRLHRLDHAHRLALRDLAPGLRRLYEDHVAQLLLRVVGDADAHGAVRLAAHPLVALGVAQLLRQFHGDAFQVTRIFPWRTNGALTTRAASSLSRTTTCTVSPTAVPLGRRASAIDLPSVGEKVPLVTSPSPPEVRTFWCARSTPPESSSNSPRNSAFCPRDSSDRRPMKSRELLRSTVQARPASSGDTLSSMSWPYRFMPASRRSVSRAPRPAGRAPPATSLSQNAATAVAGSTT